MHLRSWERSPVLWSQEKEGFSVNDILNLRLFNQFGVFLMDSKSSPMVAMVPYTRSAEIFEPLPKAISFHTTHEKEISFSARFKTYVSLIKRRKDLQRDAKEKKAKARVFLNTGINNPGYSLISLLSLKKIASYRQPLFSHQYIGSLGMVVIVVAGSVLLVSKYSFFLGQPGSIVTRSEGAPAFLAQAETSQEIQSTQVASLNNARDNFDKERTHLFLYNDGTARPSHLEENFVLNTTATPEDELKSLGKAELVLARLDKKSQRLLEENTDQSKLATVFAPGTNLKPSVPNIVIDSHAKSKVKFLSGLIAANRPSIKDCGQAAKDIVELSAKQGIDPFYIAAIISVESRFEADVRSHAGARGLMQIMPSTAQDLKEGRLKTLPPGALNNPRLNISLGIDYIKQLEQRYKGNRSLALAAYNWGLGNVDKVLVNRQKIPPAVRDYAKKIIERTENWSKHFLKAVRSADDLLVSLDAAA